MSVPTASLSLRRTALAGDRARRHYAASRWIAMFLPWAAGVSCGASALMLLVGRARPLGVILLAVSAAAAACIFIAARFDRPPAEDIVAELDDAAGLDGALRSGHWFASDEHPGPKGEAETTWVAFHIETAASRASAVDWSTVYTRPSAARAWWTTGVLAAAAVALLGWESPRLSLMFGPAPEDPADTLVVIPSHLVGQVVEGMKAMQAGTQPSKEALTAVGQALEIAKDDPRARRELEQLFAQAGGNFVGGYGEEWGRNEMDEGTPAPEWAYEEAVSRASLQKDPAERGVPEAPSADNARRAARAGEVNRGVTASTRPDEAVVLADTRGQPGSFSSLLFGRAQAKDDSGSTSARAISTAPSAALAAALRREVVHARTDVPDANRVAAARPTTDRRSVLGAGPGVAPTGLRYDASSAGRPPAVPDARRGLLHDFFVRPADPAPATQP